MISYVRPARPKGFPTAKMQQAQALLQQSKGTASLDKMEHWRNYKDVFRQAQRNKCAFCEQVMLEVGAVEHYAPKGAVGRLKHPGLEVMDSVSVRGRKEEEVHPTGYWWLAYDWNNWLFSCERCNSAYKGTLFPVAEDPYPVPDPATPYTPLLLNPFESDDPSAHLGFDEIGQVEARGGSIRGRATIETCGLDRESLRSKREAVVKDLVRLCLLLESLPDKADCTFLVELLHDKCSDDAEFAAAARCALDRELGLTWTEFQSWMDQG